MNYLDLSNSLYNRIFIVGELNGDYSILIRLLYEQKFDYNDLLIFTGNIINIDKTESVQCLEFIRNNDNVFSVKGKHEVALLQNIISNNTDVLKITELRFNNYPIDVLTNFLANLPSLIIINNKFIVVNAGVVPGKSLEDQPIDVFYSIGKYDKDSRFYQNWTDKDKSWYDDIIRFNGERAFVCFSKVFIPNYRVPAGYNLGRSSDMLRCLILSPHLDDPVLIEAE